MKNRVPSCTCLQYTHDLTISNYRAKHVKSCPDILTSELSNMLTWSSNSNLAFNATRTKRMLFTTTQMEMLHGFEQDEVELKCKDETLENVNKFKLLGIKIDKNLNWKKHINNTTKNCYARLSVLRKIKKYTPLPVRKLLAKSLILSQLDYCNELLFDIPASTKCSSWFHFKYIKYKMASDRRANRIFCSNMGFKAICYENIP